MVLNFKKTNIAQSSNNSQLEIELLLLCSRTYLDETKVTRLQNIASSFSISNWNSVLNLARNHSVLPLLIHNIQQYCNAYLPISVADKIKQEFRTNAFNNIYLARELLVLLELFKQHNIQVISFKGPALASSLYDSLSLRQFTDLDILVAEQDVIKSKELLMEQGSKVRFHVIKLNDVEKEAFVESKNIYKIIRECAYEMDYGDKKIIVELHWQVMPKYFAFPLPIEYLTNNLDSITILDREIPALSPENNLLLLCGHGSKDCWDKFSRVCDIAQLINHFPDLNWELILSEAKKRGGLRLVLAGVLLAHNLLETSLPTLVLQEINRDKKVRAIVDRLQVWLFLPEEKRPNSVEVFWFQISCKNRLKDKIWYAINLLVTPTLSDWEIAPKSNFPVILYYFIRPLRMTSKLLSVLYRKTALSNQRG